MQLLHELKHFDEIDVVLIMAISWWIFNRRIQNKKIKMTKLEKLGRWIEYLVAGRILQETVLFASSLIAIIKDRSDLACYFLVLSIWIGGQLAQFQNELSSRYNRLLDEQERRDRI